MKRTIASAVVTVAAVLLSLPCDAAAEFASPKLLSGTAQLQFEHAEAPALSSEGQYVAFQGAIGGVSGVWRRNLQTGAIEPVATAYNSADPALSAPSPALAAGDAVAPSISADGRYIAFTTTANLEPEHLNHDGEPEGEPSVDTGCPEVYVRDMGLPASSRGAYALASAIGKSGAGITFAGACAGGSGGLPIAGAQAAPAVALSANGRSVAFTVLSRSNLTRGAACPTSTPLAECLPETSSSQVAVRNLEDGTTTLVSVTPQGQPAPGGGAYPSERTSAFSLKMQSTKMGDEITASTAAISGDGDTVAWLGTDVPAQVPASGPEIEARTQQHETGEDPAPYEVEPLWRRIGEGEGAVTKRLLAGAGLEFFYSLSTPYEESISAGSFVATRYEPVFIAPALSENGETVALVSDAPRPAALQSLVLSNEYPPQTDAYAVHVPAASGAAPEVIPLTETLDYDAKSTASYGFIRDIAISPDGSHIAFDTERSALMLPTLALISPSAATGSAQTYVANLGLGTLQRATVTYDGAEPAGGAPGLLSFSRGGGTLAFSSAATNLFYGDAVSASEVYITDEVPYEDLVADESLTSAPNEPLPSPEWKLNATAVSQRNGTVLVRVQTPGAGSVVVKANSQLPVSVTHDRGLSKMAHASKRASGPRLVTRTVARAFTSTLVPAAVQLRLRTSKAFTADLTSRRGLYAVLQVSFSATGHGKLSTAIPVTFHRSAVQRARRAAASSKHRGGK